MVEPPVCVARASGTCPPPTAAPEPAEDPPGVNSVAWGLLEGFFEGENSTVATLPNKTAPDARNRATAAASFAG